MFDAAVRDACERYRSSGRVAYHFARGKLRGDPVYREALAEAMISREGTLLDLGCGGGLFLALLAEARLRGGPVPRLVGIETRPRAAAVARAALAGDAEILTADVRGQALPAACTIVLFDVLSLMTAADQDALRDGLVRALEPGGRLLIREADRGAGWRFRAVEAGNRFKAWVLRTRAVRFHFRSAQGWTAWLEAAGLRVDVRPMGRGTPFANVLIVATRG